jgi:hypothetical protein
MGVAHALKTIAHRVGSYKDNNSSMANKTWAIQTSSGRINSTVGYSTIQISDSKGNEVLPGLRGF